MNVQGVNCVFPERALRRWAQRHLTLVETGDAVKARFRYEGSTCGNVPFLLDYIVHMKRANGALRIRALSCAPAPGDDDHLRMCSAKADLDELLHLLKSEQPLIDEPLEEVLARQPVIEPAGCVCSQSFRNHKWRAVLETIYYALTTRDGATRTGADSEEMIPSHETHRTL